MVDDNTGHGHVFPRPDGARSRCGGPKLCALCARDQARKDAAQSEAAAELTALRARVAQLEGALHVIAERRGRFSRASGEFENAEHAMRALKSFARQALGGSDEQA